MDYAGLIANVLAPLLGAIALLLWIIELVRGARARRRVKALEADNVELLGRWRRTSAENFELLMRQGPKPDFDDFALLSHIGEEVRGILDGLIDDAGAVNLATAGVDRPVIEIEYDDKLVSLVLSLEWAETDEDLDEDLEEEDAETEPEVEAAI